MHRFYHFGFDKPDQHDEIGNPISDDIGESSMMSSDQFKNDDCGGENLHLIINDPEPVQKVEKEVIEEVKPLKDHQNEEGTTKVKKDIFPQIVNDVCEQKPSIIMKRSDSALNIFDQTTILKLFSAKNWTETFFNRIFRKKFLVISPDESLLASLKHDGAFALEQQLMHLSQKYPRDSLLPAISSERDEKVTHGLCVVKSQHVSKGHFFKPNVV